MIIDGFIKQKQLPPAPPEIENAEKLAQDQVESTVSAIETYLSVGVLTKAHMIEGRPVLTLNKKGGLLH